MKRTGTDTEVDVQIMGAGSLGSLVGGVLSRGGLDVHLIGREPHVSTVEESGLRVAGELSFETRPSASTEPKSAEVTVVTVKSYDTREAAEKTVGRQGAAVSLQNGMGNEEVLDEVLGCDVFAGTTTYGARLVDDGVVECTGVGEAFVGRLGGTASEGAERMSKTFSEAGLETRARTDMPTVLWRKLAVNAGINPVTSLTRLTNGEAVERAGGTVRRAVEEVVDVAEARGVDVGDAYERTVEVARSTASNRSSMLQDVERGNRTEIDAINGYVVDVARDIEDVDVTVPVNRSLTEMVRASEADSARSEGRGRDGRDTTEGGKNAY